ncbi:hypothetical protein LTS15_003102 [Exophiala xenobiotica]|nr:hypothetical protein LTS15_003102 [Exophiala xenobiotica]
MSLLPETIPLDTAKHDLQEFLQYAALFLSNLGNYYSIPLRSHKVLILSSVSKNEVQTLSKFIPKHGIALENTRLLKIKNAEDEPEFRILQASIEQDDFPRDLGTISDLGSVPVKVVRGDRARDLGRVSSALSEAAQYCASDIQPKIIACLQETFRTGDIEDNKAALKLWIKDADPVVDHVLGFVEQYRDLHGTRAEFAGITAIQDEALSRTLESLVESSQEFIKTLPWVEAAPNEKGNGLFAIELFEPPSFTSLHGMKSASTGIRLC